MNNIFKSILEEQITNFKAICDSEVVDDVNKAKEYVVNAISQGNKILIAGNGGSAADAQHFAAELVGRFLKERRGLPAVALTTDSSILTCIANDYSYDDVISRQVEALGNENDIFVGISTSGNSQNIVNAINKAKEKKMITVGLLGKDGGKLKDICDISIVIPINTTARVQEVHEIIIHSICQSVDEELF